MLRKSYVKSQPLGETTLAADYSKIIRTRAEALEAIKEWLTIGFGAQDFLDDAQLYSTVKGFLDSQSPDHVIDDSTQAFEDASVRKAWADLQDLRDVVWRVFIAYTCRPPLHSAAASTTTIIPPVSRVRHLVSRNPPDLDGTDADGVVDNIDGMACAVFSNVTEEVSLANDKFALLWR